MILLCHNCQSFNALIRHYHHLISLFLWYRRLIGGYLINKASIFIYDQCLHVIPLMDRCDTSGFVSSGSKCWLKKVQWLTPLHIFLPARLQTHANVFKKSLMAELISPQAFTHWTPLKARENVASLTGIWICKLRLPCLLGWVAL